MGMCGAFSWQPAAALAAPSDPSNTRTTLATWRPHRKMFLMYSIAIARYSPVKSLRVSGLPRRPFLHSTPGE